MIDWGSLKVNDRIDMGRLLAHGRLDCPNRFIDHLTGFNAYCIRDISHADRHVAINSHGHVIEIWN